MSTTFTTASRLRRGLCGALAGGLLGTTASVLIALPVANGDPQQQCNTTVGQSIDSYLKRHPDVRQELMAKAQAESPGSPNALLDYLQRHPDVRQALITLSQQCTS
ncbi:heme-binding protein [Mycobacterium botniense]|uniref:Haemophore haem-binding domain-containing protein n=1 Tax=Mycobacterium botniense TaxID=84962 RepID=A0A7I9XWV2_9MYCO|nr:heme-binding protein [Mycobacterium botniense]GFG74263.1 hypothetical protein MBOT_16280 [Mycobacterium botniense]